MASSSATVCLLVLLGVVLASSGPVQYVSEILKNTQESIADTLDLRQPEIGSNPLFGFIIKSINSSCQRKDDIQLMNATLDVYMRIFSSILQQHQLLDRLSDGRRSTVKSNLTYLQQKMEELQNHLGHLNHKEDKEDALGKLNKIKVDDPMVQRKALAEFIEVYQTVSVIHSRSR